MAQATTTQQYVLLPAQGLRATGRGATPGVQAFLRSAQPGTQELTTPGGRPLHLRVIDAIGDGARLVEATAHDASALRSLQPTVRVVPVVYYVPAVAPQRHVRVPVVPAGHEPTPVQSVTIRVISEVDGTPVPGAIVVGLISVAAGQGAQGVTDSQGQVELTFASPNVTLERLYVYPTNAFWSLRRENVTLSDGSQVALRPLDLDYTDSLRHYYRNVPDDAGQGVTVGVVDTGVSDHPDLVIAGGANTVAGEDPADYGDNGQGHGTHVAGIVAARGRPPTGIRGVAPGVNLWAYRVFAQGSGQASSFAIAKAIDQAVTDGCDLINLSLGGGPPDPVLQAAIADARAGGSACIIAAGNNLRGPVSFPASDELAVAVSALGRLGTFPDASAEVDTVVAPFGADEAEFIGDFSNVGPQMDLTAPGVGVISTVPGSYSEISGTSMACPAATGVAARLLASSEVLGAARDATRSEAIVSLLLASARDRGFPDPYEGHGLPQPC
jgi:subtilisin